MVASDVNLSSQPTTQQVLFTAFLRSLGWVPPLSSLLGYVNPQKSYGPGLLTLIKLLLQSTRMMSLSKLTKMGTPWRLISLAPLSSLQAWPAMAEASGKTAGTGGKRGGGNRVLHNMHQLNSLKSRSQVSRTRLKWQGGGCSDMYPGGALMVTDNLLCRSLIEPDGLINESQVLQAKGKGSGCWAYCLHFPNSGQKTAILQGHLLPTSFLGFAVPIINSWPWSLWHLLCKVLCKRYIMLNKVVRPGALTAAALRDYAWRITPIRKTFQIPEPEPFCRGRFWKLEARRKILE